MIGVSHLDAPTRFVLQQHSHQRRPANLHSGTGNSPMVRVRIASLTLPPGITRSRVGAL